MVNLIEDLSQLTCVSDTTLKKFVPLITYVIGHAVHEGQCEHKDIVEIDLGVGDLHIKIDDDEIRYRFVPSTDLQKTVSKTVTSKTSPIVTKLHTDLQDRIQRTYKEML